jgi:hypothetical protein
MDCQRCHEPEAWARTRFDHGRDTEFPLVGAHARVVCEGCHRGIGYEENPGRECVACHLDDDVHAGRHGAVCDDCHGVDDWASRFDHDRETSFPLRGEHRSVACTACHPGSVHDPISDARCHACHEVDDVHRGGLGQDCGGCHDENAWKASAFDHDVTRFPLLGIHAVVPCEQCHARGEYRMESVACVACHRDDDAHAGRLGTTCEACHAPSAWNRWSFDHDAQTDFPLDGKHEGLACHACHDEPVKDRIVLPTACVGCHEQDDVHDGSFGRACERCHETGGFQRVRGLR